MSVEKLQSLAETNLGLCVVREYIAKVCNERECDPELKKKLNEKYTQILVEKHERGNKVSLEEEDLEKLIEGAKRIKLDPCELQDEKFSREYHEECQKLLAGFYDKWRLDDPERLKRSFNNVSSTVKLDLLDPKSKYY